MLISFGWCKDGEILHCDVAGDDPPTLFQLILSHVEMLPDALVGRPREDLVKALLHRLHPVREAALVALGARPGSIPP